MNSSHFPHSILICLLTVLVGSFYALYIRWHVPRRHQRAMQQARAKVERLRREEIAGIPPTPTDYHYAISFNSQGLTITDLRSQNHAPVTMPWSNVILATAFKRDLFAMDCICLHLEGADGIGVELDEDMAGWNRLLEVLPMKLPGCKPYSEWYSVVAFPAFVANPTEIYVRATPPTAEEADADQPV